MMPGYTFHSHALMTHTKTGCLRQQHPERACTTQAIHLDDHAMHTKQNINWDA
jgi:hypothetical protein